MAAPPPSGAIPPPPPLRAPPDLPDEIVEDIFVRVPPSDPALLLRGALACKRWARLFAGSGFRRRYRERHRAEAATTPMLGFLANLTFTGGVARFIPTTGAGGFCPASDERPGFRAHDARHGRVLLARLPAPAGTADLPHGRQDQESVLTVWDSTTDELHHLPLLHLHREILNWNAAMLCDGGGGADGDHVDCHSSPFRVAFVGIDTKKITAHVFSSESGTWSKVSSSNRTLPGDDLDETLPGVLAGNAVHFMLLSGNMILKLDLAKGKMTLLVLPRALLGAGSRVVLMAMDDGRRLGFAEMWLPPFNALRLWSVQRFGDGDGVEERWVLTRNILLDKHLPADALVPMSMPCVAAYAEGAGVIFLKTIDGLYALDLKSGQAKRIRMTSGFYDIVPYVSFYTPVVRGALTTSSGEGTSAGASTSVSQTHAARHQRGFLSLAI